MKSLEVRCCCVPQKLLGWIIVEDDYFKNNSRMEMRFPIQNITYVNDPSFIIFKPEIIVLYPRIINFPDKQNYLAINSNDIPIEKLRLIKNFVEFKEN